MRRGNATLIVLVMLVVMTTSSLQLWRVWSMQASVLQQREQWYKAWFAMNVGYDACCHVLQTEFDYYADQARRAKFVSISLPVVIQQVAPIAAQLYFRDNVFVVVIIVDTGTLHNVTFLIEKQEDDSAKPYLVVHHVTFGASV